MMRHLQKSSIALRESLGYIEAPDSESSGLEQLTNSLMNVQRDLSILHSDPKSSTVKRKQPGD